jgi:excisionase family DNA binding protein
VKDYPTVDKLSEPGDARAQFAPSLAGSLMVVRDVAELLGISRQRVLKLIEAGQLDGILKGHQWLISALSVQNLIDARRQAAQDVYARRRDLQSQERQSQERQSQERQSLIV